MTTRADEIMKLTKAGWRHHAEKTLDGTPSDVLERMTDLAPGVKYEFVCSTCSPFGKPHVFAALRRYPPRGLGIVAKVGSLPYEPVCNALVPLEGDLVVAIRKALVELERTAAEDAGEHPSFSKDARMTGKLEQSPALPSDLATDEGAVASPAGQQGAEAIRPITGGSGQLARCTRWETRK